MGPHWTLIATTYPAPSAAGCLTIFVFSRWALLMNPSLGCGVPWGGETFPRILGWYWSWRVVRKSQSDHWVIIIIVDYHGQWLYIVVEWLYILINIQTLWVDSDTSRLMVTECGYIGGKWLPIVHSWQCPAKYNLPMENPPGMPLKIVWFSIARLRTTRG